MLSMKCKYAVKALIRLAQNYDKAPVQTNEIARLESIPKKFLEQILLELKHNKIVNSKQGSRGGYYLLKTPKQVTVADIYRIFDGPIALLPCVSLNYYEKCEDCVSEKNCLLRDPFIKIREGTRLAMSKITLESFLKDAEKQRKRK